LWRFRFSARGGSSQGDSTELGCDKDGHRCLVGSVLVMVTVRAPQFNELLESGTRFTVLQPLTLWDKNFALIRPCFSAGHLFIEPSRNLPPLQTLLGLRWDPGCLGRFCEAKRSGL